MAVGRRGRGLSSDGIGIKAALKPTGLLPRGVYRCRGVDSRNEQSKYGYPVVVVRFRIEAGPYQGRLFEEELRVSAARKVGVGAKNARKYDVWVYVRRGNDGTEFNGIGQILRAASEVGVVAATAKLQQAVAGHDLNEFVAESEAGPNAGDLEAFTTGFEVVGGIAQPRRANDWYAAFRAACNGANLWPPRAPAFLSAHAFTDEFRAFLAASPDGSVAGFAGRCYSPLLWIDIDRDQVGPDGEPVPDIKCAIEDARTLVGRLLELGVPESCLLVFFTGNRGFHIGVFAGLFAARPSERFAKVAKLVFAEVGRSVGCEIDENIYKTVQPLRAPNSPNEKTGLFKVRISLEELQALSAVEILEVAKAPRLFDPPYPEAEPISQLAAIWRAAEHADIEQQEARLRSVAGGSGDARLFRATLDFLTVGAPDGERANEGFRAGMNLLDFGDIESLVEALLAEGFAKSGYPDSDARQQIAGVLRYWREQRGGNG